ncbi:hypothetical protein V5O48_010454 [Marasmius crinis-equi]|uniref:Uncharacterized protein n=1 Tax=Marasmius crinis-equi TaxID=585013 RepID=A0ABR3F8B4_9AGAR
MLIWWLNVMSSVPALNGMLAKVISKASVVEARSVSEASQKIKLTIGGSIGGGIAALVLVLFAYAGVRRSRKKRALAARSRDYNNRVETRDLRGSISGVDSNAQKTETSTLEAEGRYFSTESISKSRSRLATGGASFASVDELDSYSNTGAISRPSLPASGSSIVSPFPVPAVAGNARLLLTDPEDYDHSSSPNELAGATAVTSFPTFGSESPGYWRDARTPPTAAEEFLREVGNNHPHTPTLALRSFPALLRLVHRRP